MYQLIAPFNRPLRCFKLDGWVNSRNIDVDQFACVWSIFEEAGVEITNEEALQIIKEVTNNGGKLESSLKNISKSMNEFKRVLNEC